MRYLLLFCTLWSINTYSADVAGLKIPNSNCGIQSSTAFSILVAMVHDSSPRMLTQLDWWLDEVGLKVDQTYPDAQEFAGKTFIDIAWGGALHYGALDVFEKVLSRVPDISQTKFGGDDLLTAAKLLVEAGQLGLFSVLPPEDAANMYRNAPRILAAVMQHPTYARSVQARDKSLPSTYSQTWDNF